MDHRVLARMTKHDKVNDEVNDEVNETSLIGQRLGKYLDHKHSTMEQRSQN